MRRRRLDAVFGMGETHSGFPSDVEEDGASESGTSRSRDRSEVDLERRVEEAKRLAMEEDEEVLLL